MTDNGIAVITAREQSELSTREEQGRELSTAHSSALAQHEIQSAILVAVRNPRDEDVAFEKLMKSSGRQTFAASAIYEFRRGAGMVKGPSVKLAREAARVWGNIRYGFDIIRDDEQSVHLRGWAWDMETNTKVSQDANFRKAIQRKDKVSGRTEYKTPDERDLRELVNKHGAIAERNCILKVIPPWLTEDAMIACRATSTSGINQDIDGHRKKIILAFSHFGVGVKDLESYLGNELRLISADQLADLQEIWKSISDGNSHWSEYSKDKPKELAKPSGLVTAEALTGVKPSEPKPAQSIDPDPFRDESPKQPAKKTKTSQNRGLLEDDPEPSGMSSYPTNE